MTKSKYNNEALSERCGSCGKPCEVEDEMNKKEMREFNKEARGVAYTPKKKPSERVKELVHELWDKEGTQPLEIFYYRAIIRYLDEQAQ